MGGSEFIDAQGKPLFNQGGGLAALKFMKKLIDEGLVDPASSAPPRTTSTRRCSRASTR